MNDFGLPYMGSKAKIAASIALNFPVAENFYDLFGGGFAISHYMLEKKSTRYKYVHYNEIQSDVVELVKSAINGDFNYDRFKPEWISREMFHARKETDAYVRCLWSFGNDQKTYLFGENIEPYKKSMHMAVVFDEFDELAAKTLGFKEWPKTENTITKKRLYLRRKIEHYRVKKIPEHLHRYLTEEQRENLNQIDNLKKLQELEQLERVQQVQQLERVQQVQQLEQLERVQQVQRVQQLEQLLQLRQLMQLERLQQLEQLERLSFSALDYRDVPIKENSIVYCDIPYRGTADYQNSFNHKEFYEWAATRPFPVFISEYTLPDNRFKLIYSVDKRSMLSKDKSVGNKSENLYWNGK